MDNIINQPTIEQITEIEYDYLEDTFIDDCGNCYKTLEDIPKELHHLVKPIKPIGKLRLKIRGRKLYRSLPNEL